MRLNIVFLSKILEEYKDKTYLDSIDLIRIEKKVNLESKLNNNENLDEIQQIVSLLRSNYKELRQIKIHSSLLELLSNKKLVVKNINTFIPSELEEIKDCIDVYFSENIREYFQFNFKQNHFKLLSLFSKFAHLFSNHLVDFIQEVLIVSLDNTIALLNSKTKLSKTSKPLLGILNQDFYLLLNQFNCYEIEEKIRRIVNITANKYNESSYSTNHKIYLHIMVELNKFNVYDEDLAETIHNNYEFAEEKTRTIQVKVKNILKNKFVWFICAVWIFGFFLDNNQTNKVIPNLDNQYISSDSILSPNLRLFKNLNIAAEYYQYLDSFPKFKNKLESDLNLKRNDLYRKDLFLKMVDTQKLISINVKNNTDWDVYFVINRDTILKNSLVFIPSHSFDTICFLKNESFKVLFSKPNENNNITFSDFSFREANKLRKIYIFKENLETNYFNMTKFKSIIVTSHSKNIIELDLPNSIQ